MEESKPSFEIEILPNFASRWKWCYELTCGEATVGEQACTAFVPYKIHDQDSIIVIKEDYLWRSILSLTSSI